MKRLRLWYYLAFVFLVLIEVLIAPYVHDSFIRPYFGDVIVVWVLYCFVRMIFPHGIRHLPLYIFLFSVCVEISQYFHLVDLIGLGKIRFFRILMGTSFSWIDIICYGAGCAVLAGILYFMRFRKIKKEGL